MALRRATGLILLHGLVVRNDPSPFAPLLLLRQRLQALLPNLQVFEYEWRKDLSVDPLRPALAGRLGRLAAPLFHEQFLRYRADHPEIDEWVVGGYSAGGWIFYQWLAGWPVGAARFQPPEDQRQSIVAAFTIGSPHRNLHEACYFHNDDRPRRTEKWVIDPRTLFNALRPGALHVTFSLADRTVWPDNSELPGAVELVGLADQHCVNGVSHDDLSGDDEILDFIYESLVTALAH